MGFQIRKTQSIFNRTKTKNKKKKEKRKEKKEEDMLINIHQNQIGISFFDDSIEQIWLTYGRPNYCKL
jgi:pyruvate/oxaloacetate carboxyltransferase